MTRLFLGCFVLFVLVALLQAQTDEAEETQDNDTKSRRLISEDRCRDVMKEVKKTFKKNACKAYETEDIPRRLKRLRRRCCRDHQYYMEIGMSVS